MLIAEDPKLNDWVCHGQDVSLVYGKGYLGWLVNINISMLVSYCCLGGT